MSEVSSERKELKANWKTEVEVPLLKLDEVAKHNNKQDLWMVIHGGGE
jgi:cytochrome-b5 reductase